MKIVIDIPKKLYEYMTQEEPVTMSNKEAAQWFVSLHKRIFIDGTILPKGHGRLIDADAFIKAECSQCDGSCGVCGCDCLHCKSEWRCAFIKDIDSTDVIVEADKEVEDADSN